MAPGRWRAPRCSRWGGWVGGAAWLLTGVGAAVLTLLLTRCIPPALSPCAARSAAMQAAMRASGASTSGVALGSARRAPRAGAPRRAAARCGTLDPDNCTVLVAGGAPPPTHTPRAAAGDALCERQHAHQPPPREQFDAPRCPRGRGSAGGVAQGALLRIGGAGRGLAHLGRAWDTLQSWSSVAWVVWGNTIDRQCHESANETLRYVPGCQGVETTQEELPLQAVVRAHGAWRGAASRARDARYCWAGGC